MELEIMARKAEHQNNWTEAARLWSLCGRKQDANACEMIVEANLKGDLYRETVLREAGEEPDKCENPRAWVKWYDTMTEIYNRLNK